MNVGIIVYSHSGNTRSVVARLEKALAAAGHAVTVERLEAVEPGSLAGESAALTHMPAVEPYDALVLATPVRGGRPAPPMVRYLERVSSLAGKPVALLVTGFFPVPSWGRDQTRAALEALCAAKGTSVRGSAGVGWFSLRRRRQIAAAVARLCELLV
jgi:menaquinone-dependent protoporphyrinogen IX oxidase